MAALDMGTRIVVADENQNVLRSVRVILGQEGCDVVGASEMTALDSAIRRTRPHIVLVDAELPPTDGYLAARAIKEDDESSHIAVLLMVGTFVELDRGALEASRADGFITKPFDPLALRARVREVLKELEDTHRISISDVQALTAQARSTEDVLAEVEALGDVPEIAADDLGELADQDATFPAGEGSAEPAGGPEAAAADAHAAPEKGPTRLVAFVQKLKERAAPEEETLTDEERRIIEDNEAVLREVAEPAADEATEAASYLASLVPDESPAARPQEVGGEPPAAAVPAAPREPGEDAARLPTDAAPEPTEGAPEIVVPPAEELVPAAPAEPVPAVAEAATEGAPPDERASNVVAFAATTDEVILDGDDSLFELEDTRPPEEEAPAATPVAAEAPAAPAPPAPQAVEAPAAVEDAVAAATPTVVHQVFVPDAAATVVGRIETAAPATAAPAASLEELLADPKVMERIVDAVVKRLSDDVVREIAWEVVPELAELYVQKKLREEPGR